MGGYNMSKRGKCGSKDKKNFKGSKNNKKEKKKKSKCFADTNIRPLDQNCRSRRNSSSLCIGCRYKFA